MTTPSLARLRSSCRREGPLFDLDHFRKVNKQHGHQSGDAVLRASGDILDGATAADAVRIAESVRATLAATTVDSPAGPLRVTVSAGVAQLGEGLVIGVARSHADVGLVQAKRAGRNQVIAL